MKQIPILFSTPMISPIQEDIKTQTRRTRGLKVINQEPDKYTFVGFEKRGGTMFAKFRADLLPMPAYIPCPYGETGDTLWVRETWAVTCGGKYEYKADGGFPPRIIHESANESGSEDVVTERWFPSIHMPYSACRLFLRITDIRVERLQDITEEDAMSEGAEPMHHRCGGFGYYEAGGEIMECTCLSWDQGEYYMGFKLLWQSINGPESWEANPWVWVVSFERIDKPENI